MTRYPLDIEITDDYDSTLDHYISLFVVAIAAIILALLACTAYGRFITAKTRHDRVPSSEETKSLLWAIKYAKQSITFVSLLSLPILSVQKGREFFQGQSIISDETIAARHTYPKTKGTYCQVEEKKKQLT